MTRSVCRTAVVTAPPEQVFDLLADPRRHAEIDGSGTVRGLLRGPHRLGPGDVFGMRMRLLVPYVMANTVVEFEENRRIAWRHVGRHVWRYELEPVDDATRVTETFEWAPALAPRVLELLGVPERNARSIEQTLERLQTRFR
jgi:uncharacterized protein YndB with AHSA1/START domain